MNSLLSKVNDEMKYQNAGRPKYCKYSPWMLNWKWIVKKKKFQIRFWDSVTNESDCASE